MSSKITRALPELIANKIITEEIAQNIKTYYETASEANSNRLFTIFGTIGTILVGLGIILIMAHNWDEFSRFIKLIIAFAPMLIGQCILGYSIVKTKSNTWKEAATAFLFFAVGACIAIVSQVYHIRGEMASYLLIWIVLCTPLLYVTKSKIAIILHVVFCTYFAVEANFTFNASTIPQLYFLLIAFCIPRYIQMLRSKTISASLYFLHWLLPVSLTISLPTVIEHNYGVGFLLYILLFSIFYNIGRLPYFKNRSPFQNGYTIIGSLGIVITLFILSFEEPWFITLHYYKLHFSEILGVLLFITAACTLLYYNNRRQKFQGNDILQYLFLFFAVIFLVGLNDPSTGSAFINILLFILGIVITKNGVSQLHFGVLNYGLLIIAALITCRFYDTDISFELRGIIFLLLGIGFFATNYIMLKKQQTQKQS